MKKSIVFRVLGSVFILLGCYLLYSYLGASADERSSSALTMGVGQFFMALSMFVFARAIDKKNQDKSV